ncbi:unnamed protein product [Owenia fusiformis]|uniref:ribonuclease III n=1 Tax=Owenia fusiformis TaxID=6347 RepID=A0A8J1U364_OWEFU|nr:unnamed protein product [Owenia fusiformis]
MGTRRTEYPRKPGKSKDHDNLPTHIFTPRSYQEELLDAAIQRNTIVCLGNGSGKTFIGVMLIKELAHEVRQPFANNGKRTVFLVNTESLVSQQAKVIRLHADLTVWEYVPNMGIDGWSCDQWVEVFNQSQVLVMTAQIFLDVLNRGFLKLSHVNVLIFDECHQAVGNHPYVKIMSHYDDVRTDSDQPRVLGLTASLLNNKCNTSNSLEASLTTLEQTLRCTVETTSDMIAVDSFGAKPKQFVIKCEPYIDKTGLVESLGAILNSAIDFLQDSNMKFGESEKDPHAIAKSSLMECHKILHGLGPWCCEKVARTISKQLKKLEETEKHDLNRRIFQFALTQLRIVSALFNHNFNKFVYSLEDFKLYVSPRILHLVDILCQYKPKADFKIIGEPGVVNDDNYMDGAESSDEEQNEPGTDSDFSDDESLPLPPALKSSNKKVKDRERDGSLNAMHYVAVATESESEPSQIQSKRADALCGIVFVERRHTAVALDKLLQEFCNWHEDLFFLNSAHLTGYSQTQKPGGKNKEQEEILRKFRMHETNLMVATNAVEEGVDIPKCNLVVRFDPSKDYRSFVQSKGRARAVVSKFYMLVENQSWDTFSTELQVFKDIEKILKGKCHNHDDESDDESEQICDQDLLPPYRPVNEDGAPAVTMTSAIGLINRYCAKLPSDAFTHLTPKCYVEEVEDRGTRKYIATLHLPINSPIKEAIKGSPMPTRKLAKMAVALRTCKTLHEYKELDDQLLPVGKEIYKYEDEENEWETTEAKGQPRPGTTKRKQYYDKRIANALCNSCPKVGSKSFLYVVNMKLTNPISEDQNTRGRQLYLPEEAACNIGILTSKEITKIPQIPVFTRSGEVSVVIDLYTSQFTLTDSEFTRLENIHRYFFKSVLRLEKQPMVFGPSEAKCGFLVVPLTTVASKVDIDWNFVSRIEANQASPRRVNIYDKDRETFVFNKEDFNDAVVMPAYRNFDQPQYFYVAEIRHDLTPASPFPSPDLYDTFAHYYCNKYHLTITSFDQPLLDVDHTSARLNLLTPRYINQKGVALPTSSAETRRAKRENLQQKQILVPELCDIHPVPASMWRKVVCLPAILYRLNYLLIAEELRYLIATEVGMGVAHVPDSHNFTPLDFGFSETTEHKENESSEPISLSTGNNDKSRIDEGKTTNDKAVNGGVGTDVNEKVSREESSKKDVDSSATGNVVNGKLDAVPEQCYNNKDSTSTIEPPEHSIENTVEDKQKRDEKMSKPEDFKITGQNDVPNIKHVVNNSEDLHEDELDNVDQNMQCDKFVTPNATSNDGVERSEEKANCDMIIRENGMPAISVDNIHTNGADYEKSTKTKARDAMQKPSEPPMKILPSTRFDFEVDLDNFIGPNPCTILQTLTMSNANDFFNLERLETIGDSFLKFAITVYLYCTYPGIHEGKLSYLRSKQVSNFNLYRLGKRTLFPEIMVASKFEPSENWLPPGYYVKTDTRLLFHEDNDLKPEPSDFPSNLLSEFTPKVNTIDSLTADRSDSDNTAQQLRYDRELAALTFATSEDKSERVLEQDITPHTKKCLIPYNLQTQHSLPDKSIADCTEALIGCYLTTMGQHAALLFMSWLGLYVLPEVQPAKATDTAQASKPRTIRERYGKLAQPASPVLLHVQDHESILQHQFRSCQGFEEKIGYTFKDKSYLLQAFTHASYHYNRITDCYQRLEFLGDAVLDYVITRHLYEDPRKHNPGILTDLRSALVNNNIFAALAVKWDYYKYFKAVSPELFNVINRFVESQKEKNDEICFDEYFNENDDTEEEENSEDLEIPKALGDIFESVAGAIFLDSGMSLDKVWSVYYRIMKPHIDQYTEKIPKSPVRELLELEPETTKFEKPDRTIEGKIRVTVNVVGKGKFTGVGRSYRIAKASAAKRALKGIRQAELEMRKQMLKQQAMFELTFGEQ